MPKAWVPKVIRKVQATNKLWRWTIGSIDTKETYEAKRLELARHVWATMERNDSQECRNCHSFQAMDFHAQRPKAAERRDGRLKVRIEGWQQEQAFRVIDQRMGQRIFAAALQPALVDRVVRGAAVVDPAKGLAWSPVLLEAWTGREDLSADEAGV